MNDASTTRAQNVEVDDVLLAALAEATVVVPSRRLRDALSAAFDRAQIASGRRAWQTAPVETLDDHLRRTLGDAASIASAAGSDLARVVLLDRSAQRAAFLSCFPADIGADPAALYPLVEEAWRLAHEYRVVERLENAASNDNHRLYLAWAARYRSRAKARRWTTVAELPRLLETAIECGELRLPPRALVLHGFEQMTPATRRYFARCRESGQPISEHAVPPRAKAAPFLASYADPDGEIRAAAQWARDISASNPNARVGIVVPDLLARHARITRQMDALFRPAESFPAARSSPYDVSGGAALAGIPIVHAALELLQWIDIPLDHGRIEMLLASPFLGWHTPRGNSLAPHLPERFDVSSYAQRTNDERAGAIARLRTSRASHCNASAWASHFERSLEVAGWARGLTASFSLGSLSYQARVAFANVLADFASLAKLDLEWDASEALAHLRSICEQTTFAPGRSDGSVAVLGYLESIGLRFTHLWVTGLDDGHWPASPTPNPYLPTRLQKEAGIPRTSPAAELAFCGQMLDAWRSSADEMRCSYARLHGDDEHGGSALIGTSWPMASDSCTQPSHPFLAKNPAVRLERIDERLVPVLATTHRKRGTAWLRDHALCPFRGFARNRLVVESLRLPHSFPDAIDRGEVIHEVLERYAAARVGRRLDVDAQTLSMAIDHALERWQRFPRLVRSIERERLHRVLLDYIRLDEQRTPYQIEAVEHPVSFELGGSIFELRLDRIDRCGDHRLVIDYKTGQRPTSADLATEPQLPLYALATPASAGVCYVWLHPKGCEINALADHANTIAAEGTANFHIAARTPWHDQLDEWRRALEFEIGAILAGDVRVAPRYPKACDGCGLESLCRIKVGLHGD